MNSETGNPYYNRYNPFKNKKNTSRSKSLKRRFLVRMKRRFPAFKDWSESLTANQQIEPFKYKKPDFNRITQGIDQLEECIFYYVNGVIQMATIPRSAN